MKSQAELIDIASFQDSRGSLAFFESSVGLPFSIQRIYYIFDVPKNQTRGYHAHLELEQIFIAIKGSFDIVLHDGEQEQVYSLTSPTQGLFVPRMNWRVLKNFSADAVCLVLASDIYRPTDYIDDFEQFLKLSTSPGEVNG